MHPIDVYFLDYPEIKDRELSGLETLNSAGQTEVHQLPVPDIGDPASKPSDRPGKTTEDLLT